MPIQLKEAYASMWINLSPSKQESIIKSTISKIDEFSSMCFSNNDNCYDQTPSSKQLSNNNILERMFKMLLTLNNVRSLDKADIKNIYFEKVLEVKKNLGNSNFIWSSIACNIKDAFSIEHFFMNLMTQQLDVLYFKTCVINELEVDTVDDKKKNKKKKNKKKKVKESGCCEKHPEFTTDSDLNAKIGDDLDSKENKNIYVKSEGINRNCYKQINNDYSLIPNNHTSLLTSNNTPFVDNKNIFQESQAHTDDMVEAYQDINNPLYGDNKDAIVNDSDIETNYGGIELRDMICGIYVDSIGNEKYKQDEVKINNEIKDSGKPSDFRLNDKEITKRTENKCSKNIVNKNNIIGSHSYNTITDFNNNSVFNHELNCMYEFNTQDQPLNFQFQIKDDNDLSSPVLNKDFGRINRTATNEDAHSVSNDMTISTKADSKRKKAKYENKIAEIDTNKVHKTDSEFDEDTLDQNIMEFQPKKHIYNDEYSKNRSTEYSKNNQYQNNKQMPTKLNNSNIILNDLNKIDAKPKKPKLKKINKDMKKPVNDKININYVEKIQDTAIKTKQVEKVKVNIQESKINKKNTNPINKTEPNASIKVVSYWNDEPEFFNKYPKKHKDPVCNLYISKNDSDNQSASNNKKGSDNDKFKLKKGSAADKPPRLRRKKNVQQAQIQNKEVPQKKDSPILDKNKLAIPFINVKEDIDVVDIVVQASFEDRLKAKFSAIMNSKIDEVITELENHTQRLELGRKIIQQRISTIVNRTFESDTVYVQEYGSFATRLLTPYSDIDLSIQGCLMLDRDQAIEMLQVLCDNLKLFGFVKSATSILTAIVPVIKIEADPSIEFENSDTITEPLSLKIDIIVDLMDAFNPISTALRTTDYIKYCISNYPSFYKNMLFLKFALNCNDMTNTYKGGLNAYGLCILYIAYIEFYQLEKLTDHFELLKGFLKFLSIQFSYETQAVYFGTAFK